MIALGIDPGAGGALAFFDTILGSLVVVDMPVLEVERGGKSKREINPRLIADMVLEHAPKAAMLEKVGAMPGQGVSSMFQFGRGVGMVEGVLAGVGVPTQYVTPQRWQKAVGARKGKDGARLRAIELYPAYSKLFARAKDDGRADAALIAWYAAMTMQP